jgi:hypothetical protein
VEVLPAGMLKVVEALSPPSSGYRYTVPSNPPGGAFTPVGSEIVPDIVLLLVVSAKLDFGEINVPDIMTANVRIMEISFLIFLTILPTPPVLTAVSKNS